MDSVARRQGRHTAQHTGEKSTVGRVRAWLGWGRGGWSASKRIALQLRARCMLDWEGLDGPEGGATGDNGVALGVGLVVSRVSRVAWRGSEMEEDWTRRSDELSDWLERHRPAQQPSPQPAGLLANGRAEGGMQTGSTGPHPMGRKSQGPTPREGGARGLGSSLRDQGCMAATALQVR
ncbi:hypothetical protein DHEL01_v204879 [Diaporthe helianthi]|uniref:Uncharacterized protein n=1 Tax=Diaporthe helianthi TaxID=158607 RepID=A0A2P5I2K7_DIAHE|nr:hypothetical protein DHEL01_v204879 [Diaporthe helianthi]